MVSHLDEKIKRSKLELRILLSTSSIFHSQPMDTNKKIEIVIAKSKDITLASLQTNEEGFGV